MATELEPLRKTDGSRIETLDAWRDRRQAMLETVLTVEYGRPPAVPEVEARHVSVEERAIEGLTENAQLITAELAFGPGNALTMKAGCWLLGDRVGAAPIVLAVEPVWWEDPFIKKGIARRLLARGYGFAGFDHNALASYEDPALRAARDAYPEADWGVVCIAAWWCSVTMNWLETLEGVDAKHVALWSHSRRGKSVYLAGALDERFAAVVPHMSGMGGSASYRARGKGAQELEQLLERYWLHERVYEYIDREEALPLDQHWLAALIAPRPLYMHVGTRDYWGNPKGELTTYREALAVYQWLGHPERLGIHFVDAEHVDPGSPEGAYSWETLCDFLDWHFKGIKPDKPFSPEEQEALVGTLK